MHRVVREQIERILAHKRGHQDPAAAAAHLAACSACREELGSLRESAYLLRELRAPQGFEAEPRAGFYARVMERIEAEGPVSIWNLFMESPFGRRVAVASLALAVLLGVYLVSSERTADDPIIARYAGSQNMAPPDAGVPALGGMEIQMELTRPESLADFTEADPGVSAQPGQERLPITGVTFEPPADDAVLSNLMTYREQ